MVGFLVRLAGIVALVGVTLVDASAQQPPAQENKPPLKPGAIRITSRNPLPGNWVCKQTTCVCKPLACAAASIVDYQTKPTPARRPDPKALQRLAQIEIPKSVVAQSEAQEDGPGKKRVKLVSSKVSKHLGYPSVLTEAVVTNDKGSNVLITAHVFAGPVLLTIQSVSPDRAVAAKSLDDYIRVFRIEEGPPVSPNAAPAPPAVSPAPAVKRPPPPPQPPARTGPANNEI